MTIPEAAAQLRTAIGPSWPHSKTVPSALVGDLCTALWDAGEHPQIGRMTALVGLDKRAFEVGFAAWRTAHGFGSHFPRWANPTVGSPAALAAVISPELKTAPFTCFDPEHAARWPSPHPRIVAYVRAINNPSLRDLMALYALIKAGLGDVTFYSRLCAFAVPLRKLLEEEQIAVVQSIDPDDLLFRVFCPRSVRDPVEWQSPGLRRPQHRAALRPPRHRAHARGKGHPSHDASAPAWIRHGNGQPARPRGYRGSAPASTARRGHAVLCTKQQVVEAAELLFVDPIDVAAEAVRHPKVDASSAATQR